MSMHTIVVCIYYWPFLDDIDSLNILCCEVSQALRSESTSLRTLQGSSDWHRCMERREECWEGSRELIFEHIVKNEALLEANVTHTASRHVYVYGKLLCRTVSTVGIRLI